MLSLTTNLHSTKAISRPVLPPILPNMLLTLDAAALRPEPADDVTLDRPCEALEVAFEADSFTAEAVCDAASVALAVVEAWRRAACRATSCGLRRRSKTRETVAADMIHYLLPGTQCMNGMKGGSIGRDG